MALDEALLNNVDTSEVTLRIYSWLPEAVSIGRSQSVEEINAEAAQGLGISIVRRPSGGRAIFHSQTEITYSIVAGRDTELYEGNPSILAYRAASIVAQALRNLGIRAVPRGIVSYRPRGPICVLATGSGDVLVEGRKVSAAASLVMSRAALLHGIIMLHSYPEKWFSLIRSNIEEWRLFKGSVAGLKELGYSLNRYEIAESIAETLSSKLGLRVNNEGFTMRELEEAERLLVEKYGSEDWTYKGVYPK